MLGRSTGAVLIGVDAHLVDVEVDLGKGLPTIAAVGLPGIAVREGLDRIRAALRHAGYQLPNRRVTINLAPAELRKQGTALDLPIAVALLIADGKVNPAATRSAMLCGELGLDGSLRPVRGTLSMALAARDRGLRTMLVPSDNAEESALVAGMDVVPLRSLKDVVTYGRGEFAKRPSVDVQALLASAKCESSGSDLSEVRGQVAARRALEIAAAGGHHLLLSGPPGSGKTMLAQRLPGILPPLEPPDALEITRVWSAAGLARGLMMRRPFRAPHHGISFAGMTGGGTRIRPGEISLATHGVLYLDELPEFRRDALEALRQPLEDGSITVVRLHAAATLPAAFSLVASMNPCPCGHEGSPDGRCECTPRQILRYRGKLSGPLLDRFDLRVDVPAVDLESLSRGGPGEATASVRARVVSARARQTRRFGADGPSCNARMGTRELARWASVDGEVRRLLVRACERFGLTARGYDRVRRVSRTIADLEGTGKLQPHHVAEALQYRQHDDTAG